MMTGDRNLRPTEFHFRRALLSAAALVALTAGHHAVAGPLEVVNVKEPALTIVYPDGSTSDGSGQMLAQVAPGAGEAVTTSGSSDLLPPPTTDTAAPPTEPQVLGAPVPPPTSDTSATSIPSGVTEVPASASVPPDMPPPPQAQAVVDAPMPTPDASSPVPSMDPIVAGAPADPTLTQNTTGDISQNKMVVDDPNKPDNYYDSNMNIPSGPLLDNIGPRKVDPTLEPATKLVISKKVAEKGDIEAQVVAASRALELGRYDSALELYDALYKRNQRDPRILMGRAVAQQKLGMDDVAIMSYEELLDLDGDNADAVVNMMGLVQKQYPSVALRRLTDMRENHPGNAGIMAQLGMAYAQMGDNQQALKTLGMAASMEPNNAQHMYNMGVVSDRAGDKKLAIKYYEECLQTDAVYGGGRSVPREKIYDRLAQLRR